MSRPKGAKNKRPSGISIRNRLASKGIDLADKLLAIADDLTQEVGARLKALEILCKYSQVVPTVETEDEEATENPALNLSPEEIRKALS